MAILMDMGIVTAKRIKAKKTAARTRIIKKEISKSEKERKVTVKMTKLRKIKTPKKK